MQIAEGVKEAQDEATKAGARVNPKSLHGVRVGVYDINTNTVPQVVEFDVAVTAGDETESKGGIGVFVAAIRLGTQHKSEQAYSSLGRIKFRVPILRRRRTDELEVKRLA